MSKLQDSANLLINLAHSLEDAAREQDAMCQEIESLKYENQKQKDFISKLGKVFQEFDF